MAGILRVDQANVDYIYAKTAGGKVYVPGHVIQVQSTTKTDTFSSSSGSWVDVTGLTVSITPTYSTSKILLYVCIAAVNVSSTGSCARLLRGSTAINIADTAGSRSLGFSGEFYGYGRSDGFLSFSSMYLDSPSTTSTTTYKVQVYPRGYALYVNRSVTDNDNDGYTRGVSAITALEIAQ